MTDPPLSNGRSGAKARVAAAFAVVCLLAIPAARAQPPERQTPSGLPVPRYVTLKFDKVNARAGPGDDYPAQWVYLVRGLPVQIVAETAEWRKVCDPEGGSGWVHRRTTDGRRSVIRMQPEPLLLKARPSETAANVAILQSRAMAPLDRCRDGWCRIKGSGRAGWAPQAALWGVAAAPQCK
jgi:SH3-like domain-containing protein